MAEEMHPLELSPLLEWPHRPWPPGDPPPPIWLIIRQLDVKLQREVAAVVLRTHAAMEQAHHDGLIKVAELVGPGAR